MLKIRVESSESREMDSTVNLRRSIKRQPPLYEHISERHLALYPPEHTAAIKKLLKKMHELNFFTLSFLKSPKLASGFTDAVLKHLVQPDISDQYRKALEYKLMM
jgi:hypothetical protein